MRTILVMAAALAAVGAIVGGLVVGGFIDVAPERVSRTIGEASIGGPFELVDGSGKTVDDAQFRGKAMLIYFGFTFCPDICPTELSAMADALDLLPPEVADRVQPIFITIDPERDTPAVVGEYAAAFHPRLVGLTGSPEQIQAAARAYRVYYAKQEAETAGAPYLMAHSSIIYLMDEDGRFARHFSAGTPPADIAAGIAEVVDGD